MRTRCQPTSAWRSPPTAMSRWSATRRTGTQNARRPSAATTSTPIPRASALAVQIRDRCDSNSSWLLIEPDAQSAPANVVPVSIISTTSRIATAMPWSGSTLSDVERAACPGTTPAGGRIASAHCSAVPPAPMYSSGRSRQAFRSACTWRSLALIAACALAVARSSGVIGRVSQASLAANRPLSTIAAATSSRIARRLRKRVSSTPTSLCSAGRSVTAPERRLIRHPPPDGRA